MRMTLRYKQLYFIILLFIGNVALAQKPEEENSTCVSDAEKAYRAGQIEVIKKILPECLKSKSISKETKARGYRLLTITYLYFNQNDSAEYFMKQLLKADKEYLVDKNQDPSEFVELHSRFRTDPVLLVEGHFGIRTSLPRILNNYSLDHTANSLGKYTPGTGFSAGALLEVSISDHFAIVTGGNFEINKYEYKKSQFGYSSLEYFEELRYIDIPLSVKLYFTKKSSFKPYLQLGLKGQYLLSADATPTRSDSLLNQTQSVDERIINIDAQRQKLNLLAAAALGFNWKGIIGTGYLTGKIGFSYGLVNIANASERYSNTELVYNYNYVSNDFALDNLSFMLGYALPIYRPKLKKRIE